MSHAQVQSVKSQDVLELRQPLLSKSSLDALLPLSRGLQRVRALSVARYEKRSTPHLQERHLRWLQQPQQFRQLQREEPLLRLAVI